MGRYVLYVHVFKAIHDEASRIVDGRSDVHLPVNKAPEPNYGPYPKTYAMR